MSPVPTRTRYRGLTDEDVVEIACHLLPELLAPHEPPAVATAITERLFRDTTELAETLGLQRPLFDAWILANLAACALQRHIDESDEPIDRQWLDLAATEIHRERVKLDKVCNPGAIPALDSASAVAAIEVALLLGEDRPEPDTNPELAAQYIDMLNALDRHRDANPSTNAQ